jgi:hypothetical protein
VAAAPAGAVVVPRSAAVDAYLDMCRQPDTATRVGCRLPNALGNGMPAADVSLARMLLRRNMRDESGKQAVEQEASVGALPVVYHPELRALAGVPDAKPSPARRRYSAKCLQMPPSFADEAEEGEESDCSSEHTSQHGELLGDESRSSDDDDEDDDDESDSFVVDDTDDDNRVPRSHVNSDDSDGVSGSSSSSEYDTNAVLSGGSDVSSDDDEEEEEPRPRRKTRSIKSLRNVPISKLAKKIHRIDKEDSEPIDPCGNHADAASDDDDDSSDESDADEPDDDELVSSDDELQGVMVCSDDDGHALPPDTDDDDDDEDDEDEDAAPARPATKARVRIAAPKPKPAALPKLPTLTSTDVVYAAMLFAAAVRHALPADGPRSTLYELGDAARKEAPTTDELRLRDAYFALTSSVGDRFALLARLYRAYAACEIKQEAELRKVAGRLAPTIRRIK